MNVVLVAPAYLSPRKPGTSRVSGKSRNRIARVALHLEIFVGNLKFGPDGQKFHFPKKTDPLDHQEPDGVAEIVLSTNFAFAAASHYSQREAQHESA